jgi:hypothetical protein
MAAWHLCNPDTPAWVSLSGLLTDRRLHHQRHFEFYHLPGGSRCFVVHLLLDSFRFALLFESAPLVLWKLIEIDAKLLRRSKNVRYSEEYRRALP